MDKSMKKWLGLGILGLLGINILLALMNMQNVTFTWIIGIATILVTAYFIYEKTGFEFNTMDLVLYALGVLALVGFSTLQNTFQSFSLGFIFNGMLPVVAGLGIISGVALVIGLLNYNRK